MRLPKYQALYLDGLINEYNVASIRESEDLAALIRRVRSPGAGNHDVPPPLQGVLRGYQATGFRWLKSLACCGFGGILADDMGLGKTVQAIAFILSERLENPSLPPALVVAPASLIYNWEAEIEKFAPRLKTVVIAGTKKERRELLPRKGGADVVITSYPLLRRDIADYTPLQFSSCFLDEAQYIKNPGSLTAQCAVSYTHLDVYKRQGDIVVGSQLQTQYLIVVLAAGGKHDYRRPAVFSDLATDLPAIPYRHHDVEQHQIRVLPLDEAQRFAAVTGGDHLETLFSQVECDQLYDAIVIIGNQDFAPCDHGGSPRNNLVQKI